MYLGIMDDQPVSGSRAGERKECEMRLRSCSYFHNAVNEFNFILEDSGSF